MKKNYWLILLCLLISLFIYLFYRTEATVVNRLFAALTSGSQFAKLRHGITRALPLSPHVIYSLPEGLWVFCITLTSKFLFLKVGRREINLVYCPLIFSIGLELLQLLHIVKGRFDFWDIVFSVLFWAAAAYTILGEHHRQNISGPVTSRSISCVCSYLIVLLAHVSK